MDLIYYSLALDRNKNFEYLLSNTLLSINNINLLLHIRI